MILAESSFNYLTVQGIYTKEKRLIIDSRSQGSGKDGTWTQSFLLAPFFLSIDTAESRRYWIRGCAKVRVWS